MITFPIAFFSSSGGGGGDALSNYYSNDFDGTNDYTVADDSAVPSGNSAFTVSAWVKFDSIVQYATIVGYGTASSNQAVIINTKSNKLKASFYGTEFEPNATTLSTGQWYHIALTYDGSGTAKLYLDGSEEGSKTSLSLNITLTGQINFGRWIGNTFYHDGKIDEVAIFSSELSASDVTAIYNSGAPTNLSSQSNLKGWWRMGDGANYPIIKNQAYFSQTAVNFDGSDDTVFITDSGVVPTAFQGMGNSSNYSFSCWIKTGTSAGAGTYWYCPATIAELRTETSSGTKVPFSFGIGSNKLWLGRTSNHLTTDEGEYSTDLIVSGAATWKHVAFTMNGDAYVFYINGSASGSGSFTTATGDCSVGTTTSNFVIGARTTNTGNISSPFNGEIDDCSFYNTTLSASDITNIYNSGHPKDESGRSGLLTYYKFDGDVYPVVRDETEFSNASIVFDGSNDFVDLGTGLNSYLELGDNFSYSAWVKFSADTTDRTIISSLQASGPKGTQLRVLSTEAIRIILIQSGATYLYVDSSVLAVDTWHHVVATYDGSNTVGGINLYINGSLDNSTTGTSGTLTTITSTESLKIGKYGSSSNMYEGNISDVMIFSAELTGSDVTGIYNSGKPKDESALPSLGYWRMGDNTISPHIPSALGYGTHSIRFDGTDDYIDCGNNNAFEYNNAFSISCWVKHDYTSNKTYIGKIDNSPNTGQGYYIGSVTGNKLRFWIANNYWGTKYMQVDGGTAITADVWYHVVATYDGSGNRSGMKIYLNGSAETLTDAGATSLSDTMVSTEPLTIGAQGGANYMAGYILQIGIFNTELSASDVTALYNSGKTKDLSSESGLVSYYRMGDGEDRYPNILDYKGTAHGTMTNMADNDINTANIGSGLMTNMASDDIVADSPAGTSGQMTNMASDDFVAAKGAGTMTNMTAEDIQTDTP